MKHASIIALLLLTGCDESRTVTWPDSQVVEPDNSTTPPAKPEQSAAEFTGKVIGVVDGDTIDVLTDDKETIRIRLNGIDTPERGQPFGSNAKRFVSDAIAGKMVRIETHGGDKYGRTIGDIFHNGVLINRELVRAGLAWWYVQYAPDRTDLVDAERKARADNAGLWAGSHKPVAPWDWRKLSKEERDMHR